MELKARTIQWIKNKLKENLMSYEESCMPLVAGRM
jgi:hypothetical protein